MVSTQVEGAFGVDCKTVLSSIFDWGLLVHVDVSANRK